MSQPSTPANSGRAVTATATTLTLLAFLSGCCGLAYEVLYLRALTTLLGDMLYVHAALLSTFLIGIALGAKLAHRCVRWLWLFELLTGFYALGLPWVLSWLADQALMSRISADPGLTILTTITFLTAPSLLVGFSIPLFSAYIKAQQQERLAFQGIYMAYNLGALLSILAVELLVVRWFGIRGSLALIGAINIANGIVLIVLGSGKSAVLAASQRRFPWRIISALALASLVSAGFQMFFLKLTYLVFQPHRENFAVGLSVTLFGIFLGALLASRTGVRFETLLALVPLSMGAIYVAYEPLLGIYQTTVSLAGTTDLGLLLHKFLIGCLFALPPMVLFGGLLPALMRRESDVAEESGHLLAVSSLANAVGYLVYVVLGHPMLTPGVLLALFGLLTALASLIAARRWNRLQLGAVLGGVALLVVVVFSLEEREVYLAQWLEDLSDDDRVIVYKSGPESATLVVEDDDDQWVSYNGHPSIEVQNDGVVNVAETMSGVIPALAAPTLQRALVLGLGTGITAGATASIFEHTDVVEINNAFYKMMPHLAQANLNVGENPAASLHLSDGRSFLIGRDQTYDAILNSIPAPTYYSASKIYTVEFYRRVAQALKPDGVFCSWLASANMSEEGLDTVLAAMYQSFRYCDLRLMTRGYYMATCGNKPLEPRKFFELGPPLNLIDQLGAGLPSFSLDDFFEDTRISENIFELSQPEVSVQNTDDHPVLEFMVVRSYQLGNMGEDPFLDDQTRMNVDPVRAHERQEPERFARRAAAFYWIGADHFQANFLPLLQGDPELWAIWESWGFDEEPDW